MDEDFIEYCITPFSVTDVSSLVNNSVPLDENEAFHPVPDPAIGGSGKLETYKKGNVWVSADISGQIRGL